MPTELRPFIASINRLLERIGTMVGQQKRFIADAAHELRSPITALGLQAENLDRADLPQDSRERLASLKTGIRRTAHLLEQLLALARYDAGRMAQAPVIALDLVARGSVADFLPLASTRGVDLGFERFETVFVRGEAMDLAIMLRNVLDNALRHTPAGGRIDINLYREDDNAVIRIDDAGPGIAETDLQRIFEPFFRGSHSVDEGTGLGLSIVHRIVEKHHGKITIENAVGPDQSGLRVAIAIPASNRTPVSTALQRPESDRST
jgi:two-component system OmpR family sensor kinase